jgi:hypothetical protein
MTIYKWENEEKGKAAQEKKSGAKHAAEAGTTRKDTGKKGGPAKQEKTAGEQRTAKVSNARQRKHS